MATQTPSPAAGIRAVPAAPHPRVALVLLALVYLGVAWWLSGVHAFWSPDSGVRFWTTHGSVFVRYPLRAADPQVRLHPLADYAVSLPKGVTTVYPAPFPTLSGVLFRMLGWFGLALLPIASALGAIWLTYRTACRMHLRLAPWLLPGLGLASPIAIYAVVFWDHTLQMLAVAGACYALWQSWSRRSWRWGVLAGALFGVGLWVHETVLLLWMGLACASVSLLRTEQRRLAAGLLGGIAVPVVGWLVFNLLLYGFARGPHTVGPNDFSNPAHIRMALDPSGIFYRMLFQLAGEPQLGAAAWVLAAITALYAGQCLWGTDARGWRWAFWIAGLCGALTIVATARPVTGVFAACPLLLPLLEAARPARARDDRAAFIGWLGRGCFAFLCLVLLTGHDPGMDWGSRFLLTALPFAALIVTDVAERMLGSEAPADRTVTLRILVCLLAGGLYAQAQGLAFVHWDLAYSAGVAATVERLPGPVVVTDVWWLGAECAASPARDRILCVRDQRRDGQALSAALDRLGHPAFSFLGTRPALQALGTTLRASGCTYALSTTPAPEAGLWLGRFEAQASSSRSPGRPAPEHTARGGRVLALYYPWYGTPEMSRSWLHQEGVDPDARTMSDHAHYPSLGPYDSADPAVIDRHLATARDAGIDTLVCSWWGAGDRTHAVVRRILERAPAYGLTVCVLWERRADGIGQHAVGDDLAAILGGLARSPAYLRFRGKPVIFAFGSTCRAATDEDWLRMRREAKGGFVLVADESGGLDPRVFDCTFSLDVTALAHPLPDAAPLGKSQLGVTTVVPGYDDRKVNTGQPQVIDREGGQLYAREWQAALTQNRPWVLIDSFNQWHNGSEIESSVEMGAQYLTSTQQYARLFHAGKRR